MRAHPTPFGNQPMEWTYVPTEDAHGEQWRMLSRLGYARNVEKEVQRRHEAIADSGLIQFVAGSLRQAEVYFALAGGAALDVAPLLLYYGASSLLAGAWAILKGSRPAVTNHGLKMVSRPIPSPLAGACIRPVNATGGALQIFADEFSAGCQLVTGVDWKLGEIFSALPDLRREYEDCYPNSASLAIPVEVVELERFTVERIDPRHLSRFSSFEAVFDLIPHFGDAYLKPQFGSGMTRIVLYRRLGGANIGTFSVFGRKFLRVAHVKGKVRLAPSEEVLMLMGLFALGFISRYHPEFWNPFVRTDETGERLIVESFLGLCHRYLPNLVLNTLSGGRIQFVSEERSQ